jgi:hypothetical protein
MYLNNLKNRNDLYLVSDQIGSAENLALISKFFIYVKICLARNFKCKIKNLFK